MSTNNKQSKPSSKNWIYGILAIFASLLGFFWINSSDSDAVETGITTDISPAPPVPTVPTTTEKSTNTEVATIPKTEAVEAPKPPAKPVDQPPKPKAKKKKKKKSAAARPAEPIQYNPADFRPNDFYENMPASKSALSPALLHAPSNNALILPEPKGGYRFQLAVELAADKDDRLSIFPNKKAAFDSEKPLWRIVFPDTHSGMWKQFIQLKAKPGLYYVVLKSGGTNRVVGKFTLN